MSDLFDLDQDVFFGDQVDHFRADRCFGGKFEKDFVPVAHSHFERAAENPFTLPARKFRGFDDRFEVLAFSAAGLDADLRPDRGKGGFESGTDIRRAADRLNGGAGADIDFAEREFLPLLFRNRFGRDDFTDDFAGGEAVEYRDPFDLGGRHGEPVGDHLGG